MYGAFFIKGHMSYFLSPIGNDQQCDANGNPLIGGKIYTYAAGSSTASATYTDSTSGTQQANPIILNSLGLPASAIWMNAGTSLKFVIKDSADVLIRTIDNVSGINDISAAASEWTESGLVPTYVSATSFTVPGDQTSILQVNRRVRTRNTSGYAYSRISVSSYSSPTTTVTLVNDSTTLDAGLSLVAYSFLSPSPNSVPYGVYETVGDSSQTLAKIQGVTASVAGSALTVSLLPTWLDFRSASGGVTSSGTITTVQNPVTISMVIPNTATLGTISAQLSRIVVLAINNAGTIELAAVNIAGGNDLSETGLISTTAISAGATSANVIYSTTARTSVAYRVVGYVESTQATAGTWVTAPSTIQGSGGQALVSMAGFGFGQTPQAPARSFGTWYYNTTGKPIFVFIQAGSGATAAATVRVGATIGTALSITQNTGTTHNPVFSFTVDPGHCYRHDATYAIANWIETR